MTNESHILEVAAAVCGAISVYSILSGKTVFIYNQVERNRNPILYWISTSIFIILAIACVIFLLFPPSFDPNHPLG